MYNFFFIAALYILSLPDHSDQQQSNRYYNKISEKEFSVYDSTKLVIKARYGNVYQSYQRQPSGFMLQFFVLEKIDGDKKLFFKMDELTQIKNDSTFMLCEPPLKMSGDTTNWPDGVWFYAKTTAGVTDFNVDSIPEKLPAIDYKLLSRGIYQYLDKKLVRVSDQQSAEIFYDLKPVGFFYLPDPGFLYELADFREIK